MGGGGEVNFLSGYARLAAKVYLRAKQVYSNSKQQQVTKVTGIQAKYAQFAHQERIAFAEAHLQ